MAYDEGVAERLREYFLDEPGVIEKKMFGGLAFMLNGHMCVGIVKDNLMVRVGPDQYADALVEPYVREMDFTGKPLNGFVYVMPEGFEEDANLAHWINVAIHYIHTLPPKDAHLA